MTENLNELIQKAKHEHWDKLDLSNRQIDVLPGDLFTIKSLTFLDLSNNRLTSLPSEISELKRLQTLILSNNLLSNLSGQIGILQMLEYLNLSHNALTMLPQEINRLSELRVLDISNNRLTEFPDEISKLYSLNELYVQHNNISTLPISISNLQKLKLVNISSNNLSQLPIEVKHLAEQRNVIFHITGNLFAVPPEILSRGDSASILNYYFSNTSHRLLPINEVKVNVVGQGAVGKTSIVQRLINDVFQPNSKKTSGVSISQMEVDNWQSTSLPIKKTSTKTIRLHFWDFGGQEIMHATHQFFLTKRSLYLLILDSRLTQEENRVEYWLKIIQSFGGESPVIVVGNKIDQHPFDIDRTGLQKKYPNIVAIVETSAATGAGVDLLRDIITEQSNSLPHVNDLLPEAWFNVKTQLEELGHVTSFITQDKFIELCVENDVVDETSQHTLLGFLHDLGIVLHFQDDPRLEALGILNPQWVTNGVYRILNSNPLFQNRGILTVSMVDEILNIPEYPRGKRLFIVDMMKKFELCYDIDPDRMFLVPDLLPKEEPPEMKFLGSPVFEYTYPVLPSSVITRFIVRMNQHIYENYVWRTGVLLKIGANRALVKADIEDRRITISIDGLEHTRRDALSAIRYQLDEIHNSIKGLAAQKRVPIPGAINAESVEYEYLLMLEKEGDETFLVKDNDKLRRLSVRQILSGIEGDTSATKEEKVTNIYIGGDIQSNIIAGNNNVAAVTEQPDLLDNPSFIWSTVKDALTKTDTQEFYINSDRLIRLLCESAALRVIGNSQGIDQIYGALIDSDDTLLQLRLQKQFPIIVFGNVKQPTEMIVQSANAFLRQADAKSVFDDGTAIPFGVLIVVEELVNKDDVLTQLNLDNVVIINKARYESVVSSSTSNKTLANEIIQQVGLTKLNPYIYSGPIPYRIFYGREVEQKIIEENITSSNYAVIANRRMGKTSFLFRVSERLKAPFKDNIIVYLDLQHVFSYTEFYKQLLNSVESPLESFPAEAEIPTYLSLNLLKLIQKKQTFGRVVMILDEVDELLNYDCGNNEKLFRVFRSLAQTQNVKFIFSGTTVLVDRRNASNSPLFNFCEEIVIGRLSQDASENLVVEPISKLGIQFLDRTKVVQEILEFTAQHPTLIQYLCAKLVEKILNEKKTTLSSADVSAILDLQVHIDEIFSIIWGDVNLDEKLILYLTWNLESFSKLELLHLLKKYKLKIENLDNKLRRLQKYSLLKVEKDRYRFSYKAFARHYEVFHDIDELIEIARMEK